MEDLLHTPEVAFKIARAYRFRSRDGIVNGPSITMQVVS